MPIRLLSAVLTICLIASAQATITVQQLVQFVRSSRQMKYSDKDVADYLRSHKLSERLDDATFVELQGQASQWPKALAALKGLHDASAKLEAAQPEPPPPAAPRQDPPPAAAEQARILAEVRENSLHYSEGLPNYLCLQVTHWFESPYGKADSWKGAGYMTERLSYVDHHEDYKTVTVNDQVSSVNARTLGHALSRGEFGSMLREIFEPRSNTQFEWARWSGNGKQWWYVFSFRVPLETSQYTIGYGPAKDERRITVGFSGAIFVDKETNMVMRVDMRADNIPADFPVNAASETLDYNYQKIGDQEFLLPLKAEMRSQSERKYSSKNTIDFKLYQKFSADAVIKFDQAPPDPSPPK